MTERVLRPGRGQTPPPVDLEVFSPEKPGVLFSQLVGVGGSASLGVVLPISGFLHNLVTCSSFGLCGWLVKHAGVQRRPRPWDDSVLEEEPEESRPRCCPLTLFLQLVPRGQGRSLGAAVGPGAEVG